ncbi:hypothetical protein BDN70DRAFT_380958 [Pholiota conissans]|uniref:Uncharacterized protein n=1 Tax=Pholiota conissans TaxID=109636 RepID=A0A9P5Z7J5_9AGAR|nr:hypothetical protein BDN70DRAFT_380958 [Pholiota conissans]
MTGRHGMKLLLENITRDAFHNSAERGNPSAMSPTHTHGGPGAERIVAWHGSPRPTRPMRLNPLRARSSFGCTAGMSAIAQSSARRSGVRASLCRSSSRGMRRGCATPSPGSSRTSSCSPSLTSRKKWWGSSSGISPYSCARWCTEHALGGAYGCPARRSPNTQWPSSSTALTNAGRTAMPKRGSSASHGSSISPSCSSSPAVLSSTSNTRSFKPSSAASHKGFMYLDDDYQLNDDIRLYLHDKFGDMRRNQRVLERVDQRPRLARPDIWPHFQDELHAFLRRPNAQALSYFSPTPHTHLLLPPRAHGRALPLLRARYVFIWTTLIMRWRRRRTRTHTCFRPTSDIWNAVCLAIAFLWPRLGEEGVIVTVGYTCILSLQSQTGSFLLAG